MLMDLCRPWQIFEHHVFQHCCKVFVEVVIVACSAVSAVVNSAHDIIGTL
jgi:hypothetical protein